MSIPLTGSARPGLRVICYGEVRVMREVMERALMERKRDGWRLVPSVERLALYMWELLVSQERKLRCRGLQPCVIELLPVCTV